MLKLVFQVVSKEQTQKDQLEYQSLFFKTMTSNDSDEVHQCFERMRELEEYCGKKQTDSWKAVVIKKLQALRDLQTERHDYQTIKQERH